jgi:hypothetical protein
LNKIFLYALILSVPWAGATPVTTAATAATPEQAAALGGEVYTPMGAERAGNEAGTIPPWTGGITEPPPAYQEGGWHPDPFPEDAPLYTITAANYREYAEVLTEGQKGLFETYPETWRMPVYRTRRTASYPQWVYDGVRANAENAELVTTGKGGVRNARIGAPFPFPERGVEIIWNHNLRWRGVNIVMSNGQAAVTRRGRYGLVLSQVQLGIPYGSRTQTPFSREYPNVMLAYKTKTIQPSLLAGEGLLIVEPIDQTRDPRKSWIYSPNIRRVLRVAYAAYAFPAPGSDGLQTIDEVGLYNGAPDRFEWRLVGKREVLIPYNSYRLHQPGLDFDDLLRPGHMNPDYARYELHRVWVVEGVLKEGAAHVYSKRRFYVDEDSWQIGASESYDLEGRLWRTAEAYAINYYQIPVHWDTAQVFYDLKEGRYLANGLDNRRNPPQFLESADPREFSPNALAYYIR